MTPTGQERDPLAGRPGPAGHGSGGGAPPGIPTPPEQEPPVLDAERMPPRSPERTPAPAAVRVAWAVALAADTVQWILWPLFFQGAASPFNDVVDVVTAAILIRFLGWHWAFLPAFLAELIPGLDLVPSWTAAVYLATRRARRTP